tara:strand:- start:200 stop:583 length:384 start_codon:yes stop_codon:yes gene_type:complete
VELYFPSELPEQLAFVSAAVVAVIGLLTLLFPAAVLKAAGFTTGEVAAEGFGAARSSGGLQFGLGLAALALAQDFTYLMLGSALAMAALGRVLSLMLDRGRTGRNVLAVLLQLALASLPLGYVFGYF